MSFNSYESSRCSGEPVNLYLFRYGDDALSYFAYTDAEDYISVPTITDDDGNIISFQPVPIDRSKITSSGSLDNANVTVTTQQDSGLANLYLIYPPSSVTTLVMYQGHVDDTSMEFKVVWSGKVLSCARKGANAEFTCQPISTALRRNGLRRRYQYGCPLVLYSQGNAQCNASKSAASVTTVVASLQGSRITLPAGWPGQHRADKYLQGIVEWTAPSGAREVRTILRVDNAGVTFLLGGTTRGLGVGSTVSMVLGCNHKSGTPAQLDGDCGPLHDNILNFGGQERIPFNNPIGLVNQFY